MEELSTFCSGSVVGLGIFACCEICSPEVQAAAGPTKSETGEATCFYFFPVCFIRRDEVGQEVVTDNDADASSLG